MLSVQPASRGGAEWEYALSCGKLCRVAYHRMPGRHQMLCICQKVQKTRKAMWATSAASAFRRGSHRLSA